jgi:hypothetical protein
MVDVVDNEGQVLMTTNELKGGGNLESELTSLETQGISKVEKDGKDVNFSAS